MRQNAFHARGLSPFRRSFHYETPSGRPKNNFRFSKPPHPALSPKGRGDSGKLFFGRPLFLRRLHRFERIAKLGAGAAKSAADGPDGDGEDFGDIFIRTILHFPQYQYRPMLGR